MIGAGGFRREQQKHQIDGLAVERLEIDRPLEPREQSEQLAELGQLAVRNGDAVADAGRAELLALLQDLEDRPLALAGELAGLGGELLQDLLLSVDLERRNNGIGRDEIGEQHGPVPEIRELSGPGVAKAADHRYPPVARQWASFSIVGGSIQPI